MAEIEKLSSEQAMDLAALEQSAGEQPLAPGEAPPIDPAISLGDEIGSIALSLVAVLSPALPSLRKIYTPETTRAAGNAIAAVCVKHGWLSGGVMGEWAEEISAAIILLPLSVATYQGIKSDVSELKAKALPPAKQAEQVSIAAQNKVNIGTATVPDQAGGASVSFGTPINENV